MPELRAATIPWLVLALLDLLPRQQRARWAGPMVAGPRRRPTRGPGRTAEGIHPSRHVAVSGADHAVTGSTILGHGSRERIYIAKNHCRCRTTTRTITNGGDSRARSNPGAKRCMHGDDDKKGFGLYRETRQGPDCRRRGSKLPFGSTLGRKVTALTLLFSVRMVSKLLIRVRPW